MLDEIDKYINNNPISNYDVLYDTLSDKYEIEEVRFVMYDKFNYKHIDRILKDNRNEQECFRDNIIKLDKKCIISDCNYRANFNFEYLEKIFGTNIHKISSTLHGHIADSFMQILGYLQFGKSDTLF